MIPLLTYYSEYKITTSSSMLMTVFVLILMRAFMLGLLLMIMVHAFEVFSPIFAFEA